MAWNRRRLGTRGSHGSPAALLKLGPPLPFQAGSTMQHVALSLLLLLAGECCSREGLPLSPSAEWQAGLTESPVGWGLSGQRLLEGRRAVL